MYMPQLPRGMERWAAIWCGVIFKRLADLMGWAVTAGTPCVEHRRASNLQANLKMEFLGYGLHETLWQIVDRVSARQSNPADTYLAIWDAVAVAFPQLAAVAMEAKVWSTLWEGSRRTPTGLRRPAGGATRDSAKGE